MFQKKSPIIPYCCFKSETILNNIGKSLRFSLAVVEAQEDSGALMLPVLQFISYYMTYSNWSEKQARLISFVADEIFADFSS